MRFFLNAATLLVLKSNNSEKIIKTIMVITPSERGKRIQKNILYN